MAKKTIRLPAGTSAIEVKQLRKKHGRILIVEVEREHVPEFEVEGSELVIEVSEETTTETFVAIFKQPDKDLMGQINKKAKKDEMASLNLMFNGCKLKVDSEIEEDTSLFLSACKELNKLVSQKKTNSQLF